MSWRVKKINEPGQFWSPIKMRCAGGGYYINIVIEPQSKTSEKQILLFSRYGMVLRIDRGVLGWKIADILLQQEYRWFEKHFSDFFLLTPPPPPLQSKLIKFPNPT